MAVSRTRVNPEPPSTSGTIGRRYGGVDPEERQRQRKARLIEAALAVFGEKGYHPSTVRDVCKQAKLTSRYFYESFDSMEALFRSVYAAISRQLMQATIVALAQWQAVSQAIQRMMDEVYLGNEQFFYNAPWFTDDPVRSLCDVEGAEQVGQRAGGRVVYWAMTSAQIAFAQFNDGDQCPQQFGRDIGHDTFAPRGCSGCSGAATHWVAQVVISTCGFRPPIQDYE